MSLLLSAYQQQILAHCLQTRVSQALPEPPARHLLLVQAQGLWQDRADRLDRAGLRYR